MSVLGTALAFIFTMTVADASRTMSPRIKVSDQEAVVRRILVPHVVGVLFGDQPDYVRLVGQDRTIWYSFQAPPQREDRLLSVETCPHDDPPTSGCSFNVLLAHQTEDKHIFLCASTTAGTTCCSADPAEESSGQMARCRLSPKIQNITSMITKLHLKPGEASLLIESEGGVQLYVTSSGSGDNIGIYMFGKNRVSPQRKNREQQYVKLVLSRREEDPLQDKVLAFYNQKNYNQKDWDQGLYSEMWVPYVSQVCLNDVGGTKQILQYSWTSQMSARLYCGDSASRQHFPELVDVATLRGRRWNETRVFALFRNQWNMTAVCIYTFADIEGVFRSSPFKDSTGSRPTECVSDSTSLSSDVLRRIEKGPEMLQPLRNSSPMIFSHHSYTHISVDPSHHSSNIQVLFLCLHSGGIHKVLLSNNQATVLAMYQPFPPRTRILGAKLHPSSKKLYVHTDSELVQLDVARCSHYGDQCEDCVLARDPDCGWNGTHCTPGGPLQDVSGGNHRICSPAANGQEAPSPPQEVVSISVPPNYSSFLRCPLTSHHAQYEWRHPGGPTACNSREEHCLLLMDHMAAWPEGVYTCESTEEGYVKVIRRYHLRQANRGPGHSHSPLLWTLLVAGWALGVGQPGPGPPWPWPLS